MKPSGETLCASLLQRKEVAETEAISEMGWVLFFMRIVASFREFAREVRK